MNTVEKWGLYEVTLEGPSAGNPFLDHNIQGVFQCDQGAVHADGFYDGDGIYKVRFMPSFETEYTYEITASFLTEPVCGGFRVIPATQDNHGPVRMAWNYHFAYEDATPYYSVGTTCYVWNHQTDELIEETLASLKKSGFNKIRFCIFPKHFDYNLGEPRSYPYEGTPMDSSVLTEENFSEYNGDKGGNHFDKMRFNPAHFQHIEKCIMALQTLSIEADLIMMHPYDRWGFSCMTREEDALYWNYAVARFAAYRNVWWSLANEYDILKEKTLADWEGYADILIRKDPYHHLRSIHHCIHAYDYSRPWITHCSLQRGANETTQYRELYRKPVVLDEMGYEGDIPWTWGNVTAEEMVCRFWEVAMRGGYPGHGETYLKHGNILWWSHGGALRGESWKRTAFLLDIMKQTPGHGLKLELDQYGILIASPELELTPKKTYYIYYFRDRQPSEYMLEIDKDTLFQVQVIDTWNMTIEEAGIHCGRMKIPLTGRKHMALRLIRK